MRKFKQDILDARLAARLMLRALLVAHDAIVYGTNEETLFLAGTTTILGGIVLPRPLEDEPEDQISSKQKFLFTFVNLGDCKAYYYSPSNQKLIDVTEGNRKNSPDPRDPGGRIGPYKEGGRPDLRNLSIHAVPCEEGDIFTLVSDGIHDNLGTKLRCKYIV